MPWHWQRVFRFHRHQKGNKHLALIKLPIFPLADCSLPGLAHIFCSSCSFPNSHTAPTPCQHNPSVWLDSNLIQLKTYLEAKFSSQMWSTTKLHEQLCGHKGGKKNQWEGENMQPWVWADQAGVTVTKALSSQTLLQCRGQTAFLFEKVRWSVW